MRKWGNFAFRKAKKGSKTPIDVEMKKDGRFGIYIAHDGRDGEYHDALTADAVGSFVAERIESAALPYGYDRDSYGRDDDEELEM